MSHRALLPVILSLLLIGPVGLFAQETTLVAEKPNAAHWNADTLNVYRYSIRDMIAQPSWISTQYAIKAALKSKADVLLIEMNTYGGELDAADSISTALRKFDKTIPVLIWVHNNAASAGAYIAIACDSIYMESNSTIGGATVVDRWGTPMAEKHQSYFRAKMRATAESSGRNPDIAAGMVIATKKIGELADSGRVVTLTTTQAVQYGFCEAEINTFPELLARAGIGTYKMVTQDDSDSVNALHWATHPLVMAILIMLIIFGIYFELQSPGLSFPIVVALAAASLLFVSLYLQNMAEGWEIALFAAGIVLLALEIFVIPGFGVAGISGIFLMVSGLTLAMLYNEGLDFSNVRAETLVKVVFFVVLTMGGSITGAIVLGVKFFSSPMFQFAILEAKQNREEGYVSSNLKQDSMVGQKGVAFTVLRPAGKVMIESEIYDATAETGFIEKGQAVEVVSSQGSQLFVAKVAGTAAS